MSKHARLSASAASRWIACPGSLNLIDTLPEPYRDSGSKYARHGTAAHALGEHCLREGCWEAAKYVGWVADTRTDAFGPPGSMDEPDDDHVYAVDEEMAEAVQVYLDEVAHHLERLGGPGAVDAHVEVHVQPIQGRDDMWGTTDCAIVQAFGELVVIDYKHGSGVRVDPEYNDQCMFYGLGAMRAVGGAADVSKVTIVVVQPRAYQDGDGVMRWETTPDELVQYGEVLRLAGDRTYEPDAPLVPGDHCRFCPAKGSCGALRRQVQEETALMFDAEPLPDDASPRLPDPADPAQVARALRVIPAIDDWARAVEGMALRMAERGTRVPGYKLVRKRANRRWKDEALAERRLRRRQGVKVDDILTPRKLRSPAQVEKVKAVGKKWVERHAEKPEGGLTLAPESDRREAQEVIPAEFPDDLQPLPEGGAVDVDDLL